MALKTNSPGCGCCSCSGLTRICATVRTSNCATQVPTPGATVTVTQGATTIGTATTDASGVACVVIPKAGSYTVAATGDCGTASTTVTAACNTDNPATLTIPGANLTLNFTSTECGGHSVGGG